MTGQLDGEFFFLILYCIQLD